MKLKNKMFLILFILLGFVLFFNINNVFAVTITVNDKDYDVPDFSSINDPYFFCIYNTSSRVYHVYSSDKPLYVTVDEVTSSYTTYKITSSSNIMHLSGVKNNEWVRNDPDYEALYFKNSYVYLYSNHDINIVSDEGSSLFFQGPVQEVVIPALEQVEELPKAITTTLKILIPVGLIVLAIGLIIYLIKRVIYSVQ